MDLANIRFSNIKDHLFIKDISTRATMISEGAMDDNTGIAKFGPFINVRWDSGMPYNRKLAQACSSNWLWDYRYAVSSSVVSVAQILSFYRPVLVADGITINWSYLCENQEIHETTDYFGSYAQDPLERRDMVATLMKYVGTQCEVVYTCSGSSVAVSKIQTFLKKFNITLSNKKSMNLNTLKDAIDSINPVLMYGQTSSSQGHFWIIDGYCTQVETRGDTFFPNYHIYFHANMGQGKSYTGYYLAGSDGTLTFDTSFAHFTKEFAIYTMNR